MRRDPTGKHQLTGNGLDLAVLTALLSKLDRASLASVLALNFALTIVIGAIDLWSGPELAFSIFYFAPTGAIAWRAARNWAIASALLSGIVWFLADLLALHEYSHPAIAYWNALVRTAVFVSFALVVNELRRRHEHERELARTDGLTGVANNRAFTELVDREIARARRTRAPLTLLYLDCDNFKSVNDELGHTAGDELLVTIARTLTRRTRPTDLVARLGGDEFAVLLVETDLNAAHSIAHKLRTHLADETQKVYPSVTMSIGAATFDDAPINVDQMIHAADTLMYRVKRSGKDAIAAAGSKHAVA